MSSGSVVLVQHVFTKWPQFCMPVENCCIIIKNSGQSTWTRVAKWKAIIMGRDRPRGSCVNKALYCEIFIVGYL